MEILSPAGNMKALKAAVAGGADAVYLGAGDFNARSKADNFGSDELRLAVSYCHERGVRVYLALNTLVKSAETERALALAKDAAVAGVDAFIVQDLALAKLLSEKLPDVPLHASTQMGVHNKWGAEFCKRAGFDRIIFSRETLPADISASVKATGLEAEYFVHGALCVSFSGNCYFSSLVSGYSGNRGKCLQLCRKKYTLSGNGRSKSGYMLSAKDLCMTEDLTTLSDSGVVSLKIEGRLRSPEYVYTVTRAYRNVSDGKPADMDAVRTVFNRGEHTHGYVRSDRPDIIYPAAQSNIGNPVGKIALLKGRVATLSGKYRPMSGDGFKLIRKGKETGSAVCENGKIITSGSPCAGDEVRLTRSAKISAATDSAIKACDNAPKMHNFGKLYRKNACTMSDIVRKYYELPDKCIIIRADERCDARFLSRADFIIYAPSVVRLDVMRSFVQNAPCPVLLDLPPEARGRDCDILIDVRDADIFDGYVANNVYALEMFADKKLLLGGVLNLRSKGNGAPRVLSSEAAKAEKSDIVTVYARETLMNLTHCPAKQLGYDCTSCNSAGMTLRDESGAVMPLRRHKLHYCYYELLNSKIKNISHKLDPSVDLRLLIDARDVDVRKAERALKDPYGLEFDNKNETCGRWGKGVK